jgi:transposase
MKRRYLIGVKQDTEAGKTFELAAAFLRLACERQGVQLAPWLAACERGGLEATRTFAAGIWRDYAAVRAALTLPWSSGQAEGKTDKLKLRKS